MGTSLRMIQKGIMDAMNAMQDRMKIVDGYLNKVVYPAYRNRQRTRFQTQNESEGKRWKELKPSYEILKQKRFASYPGGGKVVMIATGRLKDAVTGDKKTEHRKIVSGGRLTVSWTTPYAIYTEDVRPVNEWDPKKDQELRQAMAVYLIKGEMRSMFGGG